MQNQLLQSGSPPVPVSVLCRLFGLARSSTYYQPCGRHLEPQCDPVCVEAIRAVLEAHPTYGVRMTHARLTDRQGMIVNCRKVHRIMRLHRGTCRQRRTGRRPCVQPLKSIAAALNCNTPRQTSLTLSNPPHQQAACTSLALVHL